MANNGEIRRVLGKSQKNIASKQKELEVKKNLNNNSSNEKDAVAELVKEEERGNSDEIISANKLVALVPINLVIIVIIAVVSFIVMTKDSIPSKRTQTVNVSNEQVKSEESNNKMSNSTEKEVKTDKKEVATTNTQQNIQPNNTQKVDKKSSNTQVVSKPVVKSTPRNKYKDPNEYLKDVTSIIKDLYISLYSMDNVTMLVDFKNNKYTYITGEGTRNCGGLYRFIYENQSKFPRYYDRKGNPIPIKITVNGREVTKVALAISTYDLVMERTADKTIGTPKTDFEKSADYFFE